MKEHEGLPPLSFGETLSQIDVPHELRSKLIELKEKKQTSTLGEGGRIAAIDEWIASSFERAELFCRGLWKQLQESGAGSDLPAWEEFDALFYHTVTDGSKE